MAHARLTLAAEAESADHPETVAAANEAHAAYCKALTDFMFSPVKCPIGLQRKLEWFHADDCSELARSAEIIAVMAADAKRIADAQFELEQRAAKAEKRAEILLREMGNSCT